MMNKSLETDILTELKAKKPLVHSITNYVTVNDCANVILAIGAAPIMADEIKEMTDISGIANALVLNLGTLNQRTVESMLCAGKLANEKGNPVVLDPVGAGASQFRNKVLEDLLKTVKFTVIRGNISEISFLAGLDAAARGVDVSELDQTKDGRAVAKAVAKEFECIVVITGKVDYVSDGNIVIELYNGHEAMSKVTGTGCMLSAILGAFVGTKRDPLEATLVAVGMMGLAGEKAFIDCKDKSSGSYRVKLIDALSQLDVQDLMENIKMSKVK